MTQLRTRYGIGVLLAGVSLLATTSAQGIGFGAYFEYARGIGEIDVGFLGSIDRDSNVYGAGFALDTNVARDSLFNYRLNVGYEHTSEDNGPSQNGVALNNMFGFGVYRSQHMRAWLGPSVRLDVGVISDTPAGIDWVDVGIGGGVALGLNLHTGDIGSAALTFGYQYQYVASIVGGNGISDTTTFDGQRHLISVNLSYFFRSSGDRFRFPAGPRK